MPHQTTYCAALGHFIYSQALIYCPHEQAWTIVYSAGTDENDMCYDHQTLRLGPFDGLEDVIARARATTLAVVQTRHRQFLAGLARQPSKRAEAGEGEPF